MIFDGRYIDEIQDQEFESLVSDHYSERQSLEFKETYSTKNDDDKLEVLRDISSLANGGGGYLIVGIRDDGKGKAQKFESLPLSDAENIKKSVAGLCMDHMPRKSKLHPQVKNSHVIDRWLKKAFEKADPASDLIILENPTIRDGLDQQIMSIWPAVKQHLESTGYAFTPLDGVLKIEGRSGHILTRAMPWMLHGDVPVFHRGALECTRTEWTIDSEFFLSIPSSVNFRLIREIIGNSRLAGCAPELTIHKDSPEDYYQMHFHAGNGESWGLQSAERIIERIKKCIDGNIAMNDFAIDGKWNEEIVGEFLTSAYEVYEAH